LDLAEGTVQAVAAQEFFPALLHAAGEVVQTFPVAAAAPEVLLQGVPGRVTGHDVLGYRVERLRQVYRRCERVGSSPVPAIP
jgi:hypothetical protein